MARKKASKKKVSKKRVVKKAAVKKTVAEKPVVKEPAELDPEMVTVVDAEPLGEDTKAAPDEGDIILALGKYWRVDEVMLRISKVRATRIHVIETAVDGNMSAEIPITYIKETYARVLD